MPQSAGDVRMLYASLNVLTQLVSSFDAFHFFYDRQKKVEVVEKGMMGYNTHISTKVKFN